MNREAFIQMTGKTPEQAHHEMKMAQRAEDLPQVDALLQAGWKFELPEVVNGWGPNSETEPMSWYWRSPAKRKGSKGRKYWSTNQAYNALRKLTHNQPEEQGKEMTTEYLHGVYDILTKIGGANESMRDSFVHQHAEDPHPCTEWRFGGHLGYGGKYRSKTNTVDCYPEDETPERRALITELNALLRQLRELQPTT